MATDSDENPSARRLRIRRTRAPGGFSGTGSSGSTRSESLRDSNPEIDDEVDDAIDPEQVRDHVVRRSMQPRPGPNNSVAQRNHAVQQTGNASFAKEHRMLLLQKALTRGMGLDILAQQLGCSVSTLQKDRAELFKRHREMARELDINQIIGEQTMFYNDVTAMAMRIASQEGGQDAHGNPISGNPLPMRLAAMRTALASKADMNRFLNTAGVYDVQRFRRAEDGTGMTDIQMLMARTAEMLEMAAGGEFTLNEPQQYPDDLDGPLVEEL